MASVQGQSRLGDLNQQMFGLVSSFPRATSELVDFHFKSTVDQYLDAIAAVSARKIFVASEDSSLMESSLRRVLLLADVVVFNCASYVRSPGLSFFPIPDEFRSPVLGLAPVLDPEMRSPRPPKPVEVAYLVSLLTQKALESSAPIRLLGMEWTGDARGWERSEFTRTSEPYQNDRGERCHIAGGPVHVQLPKGDSLLEELRPLLETGRVVFAPFIRTAAGATVVDEGVLKASLIDAVLTVEATSLRTASGSLHPLVLLKIPYLENVPLQLLARILEEEQESIRAFRLALDRALEDIEDSADPSEAARVLRRLKREVIDDELEKVHQVCDRVCRMNSLTKVGAFVATGALSIAGILGLDPPSIVIGGAGVATATVAEMYRSHEEKRAIRRSPMHFAWRLESAVRQ